ncbi:MAG: hypothetical protein ABIY51_01895, partial [Ferruginibacter sp.]
MKKIKILALALVTGLLFFAASAFTAQTKTAHKPAAATTSYFELSASSDPLVRTNWILSTTDPGCPTTHSAMPCRIEAVADGN